MTNSLSQVTDTVSPYTPAVVSQIGACLHKYIYKPFISSTINIQNRFTQTTGISNPVVIWYLSASAISFVALTAIGANILYQKKKLQDYEAQLISAIQNGRANELERFSQNPLTKKIQLYKLLNEAYSSNDLPTIRVFLKNFTSTPYHFSGLLKKAIDEERVDIAKVIAEVIVEKNFEGHNLFDFIWEGLKRFDNYNTSQELQEIREVLISINPNVQDDNGNTFLHKAINQFSDYNEIGIVRYLLSIEDVNANAPNNAGVSPLAQGLAMRAEKRYHTKFSMMIPLFLAREDLTLHRENIRDILTPNKADNYEQILNALFEREDLEIDTNLRDDAEKTPLHKAVEEINLNAVRLLIQRNADVNAQDNRGNTPLHFIAQQAARNINSQTYCDYIKTLLDKEADPTIQNDEGTIPYQTAGNNYAVKRLLEMHITDEEQRMDLVFRAIRRSNHQELALLLRETEYVNDQRLLEAAFRDPARVSPEIIYFLLKKNAPFVSPSRRTLFMEALNSGNFSVCLAIKAFIEETGAERDNIGNSHFHFAAQKSDPQYLLLLDDLENQDGFDNENNNHDTPLVLALRNGCFETARVLIDQGANTDGIRDKIMQNPELMQATDTAIDSFLQQFTRAKGAF
ncbi:MAG: hypothetical protein ChlgKO_11950 [Chlamydiales bacterium]